MCNYDKPFLSYDEMIQLLIDRGLIINDIDFARSTLSFMSYYTIINGYLDSRLYDKSSDHFKNRTTFEDLYFLHIIDTSLDALLLKNILYIEIALKSRISHIVSKEHGVWTDYNDFTNSNPADYLCRDNYDTHAGRSAKLLHDLKKTIQNPILSSDSISHYKNFHNHVPAWILTSGISFYTAIQWFMILKGPDKTFVANEFIPTASLSDMDKKEYLRLSLDLMRDFRNKIAHGHPTFSIVSKKVQLPKVALLNLSDGIVGSSDYTDIYARSGLLGIIATIYSLLNDSFLKSLFYEECHSILSKYIEDDIRIAGIPVLDLFHLPSDILLRMNSQRR